jgi:hypothetical protein
MGLLGVPIVWQHCRALGALHWTGGAVVDVAAAVTSVVVLAIDVVLDDNAISVVGIAVVVASVDCSVVRMVPKSGRQRWSCSSYLNKCTGFRADHETGLGG